MIKLLLTCLIAASLVACGDDAPDTKEKQALAAHDGAGRINLLGELVYRQRIALPPGATANVSLSGPTGGKDNIITQIHLSNFEQVPILFSLTIPDDAIKSTNLYRLTASIVSADGKPLWHTPEPLSIDPGD